MLNQDLEKSLHGFIFADSSRSQYLNINADSQIKHKNMKIKVQGKNNLRRNWAPQ